MEINKTLENLVTFGITAGSGYLASLAIYRLHLFEYLGDMTTCQIHLSSLAMGIAATTGIFLAEYQMNRKD